ncbi:MAG: Holliday junction resolvase RuvX [Candidatus Neomarinimicrobiota bacterium]
MGRILGVDYGDSRIGLALSDPNKIIASPFKTIKNKGLDKTKKEIFDIVKENKVDLIVLGLPVSMSGTETNQTKKVRKFQNFIQDLDIPIKLQDERLSSFTAKKSLIQQKIKTGHNKHFIDSTAAAIFLQQHLDSENYK